MIKLKRLHPDAVIPKRAHDSDAGVDLVATSYEFDGNNHVYGTGIGVAIPDGYVGLLLPRSSNSKTDLLLANSVGVIDSGYTGELIMKFKSPKSYIRGLTLAIHSVGDRIGQLVIVPCLKAEFVEVDDLGDTERGEGGFGSTGSK